MTQLYINGRQVSLPKDFELDFNVENPFFTRNGDYTYDIDIDLSDPKNRDIYRHINRPDALTAHSDRDAVIICDGEIQIAGKEIILGTENDIVKIQIVAGNSGLNYICQGKKKLRSIDFGTLYADDKVATDTASGCYPRYKFVCTPIIYSRDGQKMNVLNQVIISNTGFKFASGADFVPQPYLLYIIDKLLEQLGYTVVENALAADPRWCRLFLVNGYKTNKVTEMLPDWSIDEFITEVEKFFNCIFVVDKNTTNVRILRLSTYYHKSPIVFVDKILDDERGKKYNDKEESLYINYDNVRYELPDFEQYKYMHLDDKVKKACQVVEKTNYWDFLKDINTHWDDRTIMHAKDFDVDFVGYEYKGGWHSLYVVDRFADITNKVSDNETVLKIIPAEYFGGLTGFGHYNQPDLTSGGFFAAYARNSNPTEDTDNEAGINEMIKQGVKEEDKPNKLFVALYIGIQNLFALDMTNPLLRLAGAKAPMSTIDTVAFVRYEDPLASADCLIKLDNEDWTLRLAGDHGLYHNYYTNTLKVDTSTEYEFNFICDKIPDQRSIFVFNNQTYYCKSLSVKINAKGRDKVINGIFYRTRS